MKFFLDFLKIYFFTWIFCICMTDFFAWAQEVPLDIKAGYSQEDGCVKIKVFTKDVVRIQAFTFTVDYDTNCLELYKGNDELPGGYGYDLRFQEAYEQSGGILLANEKDQTLFFSGVNQSETLEGYRGEIAQITLLAYQPDGLETAKVRLGVTAWQSDGQSVSLDGQEVLFVRTVGEDQVDEDEGDGFDVPESGVQMEPQPSFLDEMPINTDTAQTRLSEDGQQDGSAEISPIDSTESPMSDSQLKSDEPISTDHEESAYEKEAKESDMAENGEQSGGEETLGEKDGQKDFVSAIILAVCCVILVGSCLFFAYKMHKKN